MSRESVLAKSRLAAEAGMTDSCTIRRASAPVTDDNSGQVNPTWTQVYAGSCRIQQQVAQGSAGAPQTPGQDYQILVGLELQLPVVGSEGLAVSDEVTVTASAHDTDLVGQVFIVRELMAKTDASSRRVGVTRRTS